MTNKEELKQKLWIEVMEDYVLCAEMGHLAIDQAKHKSELRGHLSRLTDFFWNEIEQIRKEDMERVVEKIEKLKIIPNEIPHHSPYISGVNETVDKILSIIKQDEPHKHVSDGLVYISNSPQSRCKDCGKFYR